MLLFIDMVTGACDPKVGLGILSGLFVLASIIPAILVDIKRWHDRDKSGWWMLITLVPIIGSSWLLIELGFLKGTPGPNRFAGDKLSEARRTPWRCSSRTNAPVRPGREFAVLSFMSYNRSASLA